MTTATRYAILIRRARYSDRRRAGRDSRENRVPRAPKNPERDSTMNVLERAG